MCTGSEDVTLYQMPTTLADTVKKATVKAVDCRISLGNSARSANIQGQILACKLSVDNGAKKENLLSATIVFGNLYKIEKRKVPIGTLNKLKGRVSVADQA